MMRATLSEKHLIHKLVYMWSKFKSKCEGPYILYIIMIIICIYIIIYIYIQVNLDMTKDQKRGVAHLRYDGPLYNRFWHMTDDMLGPSPMHIKYSSYTCIYNGFCI